MDRVFIRMQAKVTLEAKAKSFNICRENKATGKPAALFVLDTNLPDPRSRVSFVIAFTRFSPSYTFSISLEFFA